MLRLPVCEGTVDPALLELAAQQDHVLVTYDRNTMIRFFRDRLDAGKTCPGMFVLTQQSAAVWRDYRITASRVDSIAGRRVSDKIIYICPFGEMGTSGPEALV